MHKLFKNLKGFDFSKKKCAIVNKSKAILFLLNFETQRAFQFHQNANEIVITEVKSKFIVNY